MVSQQRVCRSSAVAGATGVNHGCFLRKYMAQSCIATQKIIWENIENTFENDIRLPMGLFETSRLTGSVLPIAIVTEDVIARSIQRNCASAKLV